MKLVAVARLALLGVGIGFGLLAGPGIAQAQDFEGTMARIAEEGVINLGYRPDAAPFSYVGSDGIPAGYTIDLCRRIAKDVGRGLGREVEVAFVPVSSVDRFDRLENGDIDLLCGATTVTLDRRERMDFTSLTFVTGAAMMIRVDGDLRELEQANGRKLAVLAGTTSADGLDRALMEGGIVAEIIHVKDHPAGLAALLAGDIDAYVADRALLLGLVLKSEDPSRLGISRRLYSIEPYGIALRRGDDDLRLSADRTLAELYSGEIHRIFQAAFGQQAEPGSLLLALYRLQAFQE